jgi:hypothetical protein
MINISDGLRVNQMMITLITLFVKVGMNPTISLRIMDIIPIISAKIVRMMRATPMILASLFVLKNCTLLVILQSMLNLGMT